ESDPGKCFSPRLMMDFLDAQHGLQIPVRIYQSHAAVTARQERLEVLARPVVVDKVAAHYRCPVPCEEIVDVVLVSLFVRRIFELTAANRCPKRRVRLRSRATGGKPGEWVSVMQRERSLPVLTQPPLLEDMRHRRIPCDRSFGHTDFCSGDPAQMTD